MKNYLWVVNLIVQENEFMCTLGVFTTKKAAEKFVEERKADYAKYYKMYIDEVDFYG